MHLINRIFNRNAKSKWDRQQGHLQSGLCTQAQLQSDAFQEWVVKIQEQPMQMHRKVWEYCFIAQALRERDMLSPERSGLGFAVGQEPLTSLFASYGCKILATDLRTEEAHKLSLIHI